ncbi:MAG: hypothetical protein KY475_00250 [Planctomycetes bacterium]|nr:hypothetical protein [Planctomycetota bacterium]
MKTASVGLIATGILLATSGLARADWPHSPFNSLGPTAFGASGTMYGLGLVPVPPYFALHPPVYYNCPVPRSYGYSPYAYPGCVQTPEVDFHAFPQGEDVEPAAPQEELPPATPASNVARGKWIENPFLADPNAGMIANPFVDPAAGPAPLMLTSRPAAVE